MMAKTKEQKARDNFKEKALGRILLIAIENQLDSGTADCIGSNRDGVAFWLEFKDIEEWPKRPTTAPLRGKFEKGQIPFLKQWKSWKGHAFVAARIAGTFYLFDPKWPLPLTDMNQQELVNSAVCIGAINIIKYLEELI
jgi:hypothetical protein